MPSLSLSRRALCTLVCLLLVALAAATPAHAQSSDVNFPTPIFSNVVTGRIAPRDVGDPRRTRHFYAFRGTEGDLVVQLTGTNLSGSVDVFTARTQRPLMTITLVGGTTANATKTVYIREEEMLILRVEARAFGDREGDYRITLGGSFAPAPAGLAEAAPPELPQVTTDGRRPAGVRRVTSTGARIDEPAPEPAREETRAETPTADRTEGAAESTAGRRATTAPAPRRSNARTGRGTANTARNRGGARTGTRRAEESRPEADAGAATATTGREGTTTGAAVEAPAEPVRPAPRRAPRRAARTPRRAANEGSTPTAEAATPGGTTAGTTAAPAPPAPAAPQRLVIETRGGETIEHDMNTVRRMSVENNQLVVTTRDGRTVRRPMTDVLRVSIEPAPRP
jgi:hypothetical protein